MSSNSWQSALITLQAAGPAVADTATQSSVLNGQAKFTLPAQWLQFVGEKLRLRANGIISTASASPGTLQWFVVFGSTTLYSGGASGTLVTSAASVPWSLEIDLTTRSVGSSGAASLAASGRFLSTALSASTPIQLLACPGALTGFDSTIANLLDLQVAWGSAVSGNTLTCEDYELVSCN